MKKFLTVALMVLAVFFAVSCSDGVALDDLIDTGSIDPADQTDTSDTNADTADTNADTADSNTDTADSNADSGDTNTDTGDDPAADTGDTTDSDNTETSDNDNSDAENNSDDDSGDSEITTDNDESTDTDDSDGNEVSDIDAADSGNEPDNDTTDSENDADSSDSDNDNDSGDSGNSNKDEDPDNDSGDDSEPGNDSETDNDNEPENDNEPGDDTDLNDDTETDDSDADTPETPERCTEITLYDTKLEYKKSGTSAPYGQDIFKTGYKPNTGSSTNDAFYLKLYGSSYNYNGPHNLADNPNWNYDDGYSSNGLFLYVYEDESCDSYNTTLCRHSKMYFQREGEVIIDSSTNFTNTKITSLSAELKGVVLEEVTIDNGKGTCLKITDTTVQYYEY